MVSGTGQQADHEADDHSEEEELFDHRRLAEHRNQMMMMRRAQARSTPILDLLHWSPEEDGSSSGHLGEDSHDEGSLQPPLPAPAMPLVDDTNRDPATTSSSEIHNNTYWLGRARARPRAARTYVERSLAG